LECIWSSVTNCRLSARTGLAQHRSDLLRELGRFHFRLDNLQSDCGVAEVVVAEELRAVAYGEATFSQLRAGLILQTLWIAHQLGWRVSVDRRGRHLVVGVEVVAVMEQQTPKLCLFGSLLGELRTEPCASGAAPMIPAKLVQRGARASSCGRQQLILWHI
jgi:hypothetical protein